jgi:hypothetical protein
MKVKRLILSLLVLLVIVLEQSCISVPSTDWLCTPGERVGPITKETNMTTLKKIFGEKNIKTVDVGSEELGTGSEIITYVFPDTDLFSIKQTVQSWVFT